MKINHVVLEALNKAGKERKDADKAYAEALKKQREKNKKKQQVINVNNADYGNSPSSSLGSSSVPAGTVTIHIGDSRTVGMCAAITGSYSGCTFNSSGAKVYDMCSKKGESYMEMISLLRRVQWDIVGLLLLQFLLLIVL